MTSDLDPKKIYQIELQIRKLEEELDSERDLRTQLQKEVEKIRFRVESK